MAFKKYGQEMRRQSLRIPKELDDALRRKAKAEKATRSETIIAVLADAMQINLAADESAGLFE